MVTVADVVMGALCIIDMGKRSAVAASLGADVNVATALFNPALFFLWCCQNHMQIHFCHIHFHNNYLNSYFFLTYYIIQKYRESKLIVLYVVNRCWISGRNILFWRPLRQNSDLKSKFYLFVCCSCWVDPIIAYSY